MTPPITRAPGTTPVGRTRGCDEDRHDPSGPQRGGPPQGTQPGGRTFFLSGNDDPTVARNTLVQRFVMRVVRHALRPGGSCKAACCPA